MADISGKSTQSVTAEVLAGLKGPTEWNDPSKAARLSPGLTFKDMVPAEVKQSMNMSTPKQGPILDSWVTRRNNSSMK